MSLSQRNDKKQMNSKKTNPRDEYYEALEAKYFQTDWNDLRSIKQYNEFARTLRSLMEME